MKVKRVLSLVLVLCLILTMLPAVTMQANAAANIIINGVDIGYAHGSYFTKNGSTCKDYNNYHSTGAAKATCHNRTGYDCVRTTDPSCNCMRYWPTGSPSSYEVDLGASQCFGFARYCQWRVYGYTDWNSPGKFTDLTGRVLKSECTANYLKSKLINCAPATHLRTGDGRHSIAIVSATDYGVNLADCNYDGTCVVRAWTYSWAELASYLAGRNGLQYANSATAGAGVGHSTHTYSGSSYEADHPHRVYQKCLYCPATQYTGATTTVNTCSTCNPVDAISTYNAVLPFKAYLKETSKVYPYATAQLAIQSGGEIWSTDECTIKAVYSNGACLVQYPVGSSYKEAYVSLSEFIGDASLGLAKMTVNKQINTYIRASTSSTRYGYTEPGDVVYLVGTNGNMTQIFYPGPNGYKLAWIRTDDLFDSPYDDRFSSYCPIKGYPCATATFNAYDSDYTTDIGDIWTTDYCTINAVYADGWCQVTYPVGSGTKTGYTKLSNFVYNVSASHIKYTANAQTTTYTNQSLSTDNGWLSAGDVFYVVSAYGSASQVLYPIDAQYGGGYKLGWIYTSALPKTTYTVSYNANGGSGAPSNQTKNHGVALNLSTTIPNWTGHTFVGWATSASATSATYAPGASYTTDANLTLYAVWTLNKYEISYNANGGTNAPTAQNKVHGTNLTLSAGVPQKSYTVTFNANGGTVDVSAHQTACKFLGWATNSSATSATHRPGSAFTTNANTTLYAVWQNPTLTQYSIPVREGYIFDGWYTAASGGTQVTLSTVIASDMTVYAHWTIATYGVHYDANGGDNAPVSQTKTHGKALTLSTTVPTRDGYTFLGWATEEDPASVQYQPGVSYTVDNGIMLIAVWQEIALTKTVVSAKPTKTTYYVGDTLDTTGLKLTATYNNGTTKTITSGFTCSPTALNTAGTQTITVSYSGKTTSFAVTVNPVTITGLAVASKPTKTTYYVGDTLNTTGLKLTATYNNGTTKTITSGFTCSPTALNTAGTQTITVSYGGKTTTFAITVKEKPAGAITVVGGTAAPGETVQIAVRLDSNPGLIAARLKVAYDTGALTLTGVKDGGILGDYVFGGDLTANPYIVTWENGLASSNFTTTGNLVYLTFQVKDGAPAGNCPITVSYDPEEVYNKDTANVTLNVTQGVVTVEKTEMVDPDAPQVVVESKKAVRGSTVTVDVDIANNPGFSVLNVAFVYDTQHLTLSGIENKLPSMTMTHNKTVVWDALEDYTADGALCTLTFEVAENAPEGNYEIQVLFMSASNSDFEEIEMVGVSGILEVSDILYGDVNGDGKIASVDLAMLRKYLASVDPITGECSIAVQAGADCNGDGKITSVDLAMLRKYLASVDPVTGESTIILGPK